VITVRLQNPMVRYQGKIMIRWTPEQPEATLIMHNVSAEVFGNPVCVLEVWVFGCGKTSIALKTSAYTADEALALVLWHRAECLREQTVVDLKTYPLWKGET